MLFFVQLGFDAKLKSLPIIDMLRNANISVLQSLTKIHYFYSFPQLNVAVYHML